MLTFTFEGIARNKWLPEILRCQQIEACSTDKQVRLEFKGIKKIDDLKPFHFVLLACLIDKLNRIGYNDFTICDDTADIAPPLLKQLKYDKYWTESTATNYVVTAIENIFNLWRINDAEKDVVSNLVGEYLERQFFKGKDLTVVKESLAEIFYNIFDHAEADGNAFSFIKYDEKTRKLHVAICDFGIGIARSIRSYFPDIKSDEEAIEKAMKDNVTVKSRPHNKGMGLGNIINAISEDDKLRIISNGGMVYASGNFRKTFQTGFNFTGTLIYYEISLSHFPDLEINATFEL